MIPGIAIYIKVNKILLSQIESNDSFTVKRVHCSGINGTLLSKYVFCPICFAFEWAASLSLTCVGACIFHRIKNP